MKPANGPADFGALSGGVGSLASSKGTRATLVAHGIGHVTRSPDAILGKSVPLSVARSLSSGHLNLSQPTGSCARQGPAIAQATSPIMTDFTLLFLLSRPNFLKFSRSRS